MLYIPVWRSVLVWAICAIGILFALPNGFYSQVEQANDDDHHHNFDQCKTGTADD